jgi:hypothetical protein
MSTPVVVYTMGKVGTQTIVRGLRDAGVDVYKTHSLVRRHLENEVRKSRTEGGKLAKPTATGMYLLDEVFPKCDDVKVITLVRESIGRNMSGFFQILHRTGYPEPYDQYDVRDLIRSFFDSFNHSRPEDWFRKDFFVALGCRPFKLDFDPRQGWLRVREGKFDILLVQTELQDVVKKDLIKRFVGCSIDMQRKNRGETKKYGVLYKTFKEQVEFPEEFIDKMMRSAVMRHYYSPEQREHIKRFYRRELSSLHPLPR